VSGLLQTCRQFKKKKTTTVTTKNADNWTPLEEVRYLKIIRDSLRLNRAIDNPDTPRWIPTNPLELELIKSLIWLLSNWPFRLQILDDQGHIRYRHPGPLLEHLRSQGLLTGSPPRAPPEPGAANPFAALLPRAQEPGPPSERTRQMRKELEKTLLQRLAEEAAARKKKEKEIKKEKK